MAVYTISPGRPFLDVLALSLLEHGRDRPETLADFTVLLPTRRACRALSETFLRLAEGDVLLLPRLQPLGDLEPEDALLAEDALEGEAPLDLPPAISATRRQFLLARLIRARSDPPTSPDQALRLASELARLLDQVATERLDWAELPRLVSSEAHGDLARHWQITVDFLSLLTHHWPEILREEGALDPADRRNRVLDAQARAWRIKPPEGPIIAAGSTGSIPATAGLLETIAGLPEGSVILPGLDQEMDEAAWRALLPSHPQFGLARLLSKLGRARQDVPEWAAHLKPHVTHHLLPPGVPAPSERHRLIAEAMRPADLTGTPPARRLDLAPGKIASAIKGVTRADGATPAEEARVVALKLRQVLETPGARAALVTPDRALARRVKAELAQWGVAIDDTAGVPLAETEPGAFLRLVAGAASTDLAPVALLALLKHPLAALGRKPEALRREIRHLEMTLLRGPRPAPGIAGLKAAAAQAEVARLAPLIGDLEAALAPLLDLAAGRVVNINDIVAALTGAAEALAAPDMGAGSERLWRGEAGEAAAALMADLMEHGATLGPIHGDQLGPLLATLMAGRAVRPRYGTHPRLFIWGLLEARLQRADVMILGGLNEGTWPPDATASPWMSRPMLALFGLPQPERRIGLTAHDFTQALGAGEVLLTRSERIDGTPTVASRWLERLDRVLEGLGTEGGVPRATDLLVWARALPRPDRFLSPTPPKPTPPVAVRPRRLSVTRIERWIRDPYALYAEQILRLVPLDPLDANPGAAERGSLIHDILEAFVDAHPGDIPEDAQETLIALGREAFAGVSDRPGVAAFWWPRFERIAAWFVANERDRRARGEAPLALERRGQMTFTAPAGPFTLTAHADRIDRLAGGGAVVIDYKTGAPPSWKQVAAGLAPQLTLEAVLLATGGFEGVAKEEARELAYLKLSGGREAGKELRLGDGIGELAEATLDGLKRRIARFDLPETPYLSRPRPMFQRESGPYDHLARVKEWQRPGSVGTGDDA